VSIERHYTATEAEEKYGPVLTARKLRRYWSERRIQVVKLGNRVYYAESVLDELVRRSCVPAVPEHPLLRGIASTKSRGAFTKNRHGAV
jgi:hypothetical protein